MSHEAPKFNRDDEELDVYTEAAQEEIKRDPLGVARKLLSKKNIFESERATIERYLNFYEKVASGEIQKDSDEWEETMSEMMAYLLDLNTDALSYAYMSEDDAEEVSTKASDNQLKAMNVVSIVYIVYRALGGRPLY